MHGTLPKGLCHVISHVLHAKENYDQCCDHRTPYLIIFQCKYYTACTHFCCHYFSKICRIFHNDGYEYLFSASIHIMQCLFYNLWDTCDLKKQQFEDLHSNFEMLTWGVLISVRYCIRATHVEQT